LTDTRTVSLPCVVQTVSRHSGFLQNVIQGMFNHTRYKAKCVSLTIHFYLVPNQKTSSFYLLYPLGRFMQWGLVTE